MWWHTDRWNRLASAGTRTLSLDSGPLVVLDATLAHTVLTSPDLYVDESAFFRTQHHAPLDHSVRRTLTSALVSLSSGSRDDVHQAVQRAWGVSGVAHSQGWGVRVMRESFRPALTGDGDPVVDRAIDEFIRWRTIRHDIRARWGELPAWWRRRGRAALGERIDALGPDRNDLMGAVAAVPTDLTTHERGELFLRLVQSVVAFAGTALEMTMLLADARLSPETTLDRPFIMETLRLYPTSWRLVRTARVDHQLGTEAVRRGQEVIIASAAIHRSPIHTGADSFQAEPFADRAMERSKAFLPFGRGPGMCPGREPGIAAVLEATSAIADLYDLGRHRRRAPDPYVRALIVPERNSFTYQLKD
ncbi:cytochrome P450 [Microbacterium sp. NPDC058389]|uniref:cytochrome P450 n=1 Tax=Microbacterium sp. NPDC058389 TaxID=3346475 RepID=UPI0036698F7A